MVAQTLEAEEDMSLVQWIDSFLASEKLPEEYRQTIEHVHLPLAGRIAARAAAMQGKMLTVGLCGPQGSGKSTMVVSLQRLLESRGLSVAVLSLDDLYLTRAQRETLSREVHPLFRTRGVPGTHDISLGMAVLASLRRPGNTMLPSFDKARDDRRPREDWSAAQGPMHVLLFEGWCMGAKPQTDEALAIPVNALERDEDPHCIWRRHVNFALAQEYRPLFDAIDMLVLLRAPNFEVVYGWRLEQERKLRDRLAADGGDASRVMSEAQVARFISHYQRLTSHIIEEMPARADVVLNIDAKRGITAAK